ncbi:MAG: SoxR reducing system RseC family protein [Peptostreptococcaceae bacterium]
MKKEEVCHVIDTEPDKKIAKVKVGRHSDCKNCGACPGSNSLILTVNNSIGAEIGQKVVIEVKEHNFLSSIYIVYIQPLLLTVIGVLIGFYIAHLMNKPATVFEVVFGFAFFTISVICIRVVDKKLTKDKNNRPSITKIIS